MTDFVVLASATTYKTDVWWGIAGSLVLALLFCVGHEGMIRARLPIRKVLLSTASRAGQIVIAGIARGAESVPGPLSNVRCLVCSVSRTFGGEFPSWYGFADTTLFELVDPDTGEAHAVDLRCGGTTRYTLGLQFTCADEPDTKERYDHFRARDERAAQELYERIRSERGQPPSRFSWVGEWRIEAGQYYSVFGALAPAEVTLGRSTRVAHGRGIDSVFVVRGTVDAAELRVKKRRSRARGYMVITAVLSLIPSGWLTLNSYLTTRAAVERMELKIQLDQRRKAGYRTGGPQRGKP